MAKLRRPHRHRPFHKLKTVHSRRKLWWLLPALFSFLVFCTFWRLHLYSGSEFLHGDSIPLIDQLRNEYIIRSSLTTALKSMDKAPLKNGWTKLAVFPSVSVWGTFADDTIVDDLTSGRARLFRNRDELKRETNLFRDAVRPDRWDFYQNQIFVTLAAGQVPNAAGYSLDYQTYREHREPQLTRITAEELKDGSVYGLSDQPAERAVVMH